MLAKVYSAAVVGVEVYEVEIEVDAGMGNPKIVMIWAIKPPLMQISR